MTVYKGFMRQYFTYEKYFTILCFFTVYSRIELPETEQTKAESTKTGEKAAFSLITERPLITKVT